MRTIARLISCLAISLATIGTLSTAFAASTKLYKWIDDDGQVRYGDHIPAQHANKGNERLNDQGLVVESKAPAKTQEQLAEEQRLSELAKKEVAKRKNRELHDRILLDTYSNEEALIVARDGKIETIEANIRVTNSRVEKLKQNLARLNQHAANMERAGKPVSESITKQISDAHSQIKNNLDYIESRKADQQATREQFEADIKRFRELKQAIAEQQL